MPGLEERYINDSVFPVYDDHTLDVMCRSVTATAQHNTIVQQFQ